MGEKYSITTSPGLLLVLGLLTIGIFLLLIDYRPEEPGEIREANIIQNATPVSSGITVPRDCTVSGDFENGNIGKVIENPSGTFTMEFGQGAGGIWFHIKLSGCQDKDLKFILNMTRDLNNNSAHWYDGKRKNTPVVSHDRWTWEKINTGSLDKTSRTFTFNYTSRHNEEWIAYFYPFTNWQLDMFLKDYLTNPYIKTEIIGSTPMGRSQTMVTITDTGVPDNNKKVVLLLFREDAWETLGTYNAIGIMKYLFSDEELAVSLRKKVIFKLVPIVSVDGVAEGITLGIGNDANRAKNIYLTTTWTVNQSPKEIDNIKQYIQSWKSSGKKIDLAGRYHSTGFQSTSRVFGASNEKLETSAKKYLPGVLVGDPIRGGRFPDFLLTLYPATAYFDTEDIAVGATVDDAENFGVDTIRTMADYLGVALVSAPPSVNFTHPNMFLDLDEIKAIKLRVNSNQEPWKTAYYKMISEADSALNKQPPSVTYGGKTPPSGDTHNYYSDPPYTSDGIFNTDADRTDYDSATRLGRDVRSLGLAYAFTGEAKYADKALQFIRVWTLDKKTRMNPAFTDWQSNIEISITLPGMFYGADLIWNYQGWRPEDNEAFESWTARMLESSKKWSAENNYENWRLVFISSAAVIAGDTGSMSLAFDRWKTIIKDQMDTDGRMIKETGRTNSLSYSLYAVNAMIQTAEIARHYGIDLYNYRLPDNRSLEKALDFHAPYAANPSSWQYQQITAYTGDNGALYELAYSFKQKSEYIEVINRWKQPMYEIRTMGPVTLTHSFGAYPFTFAGAAGG